MLTGMIWYDTILHMAAENKLALLEKAQLAGTISERALAIFKDNASRERQQTSSSIDPKLLRGRHVFLASLVADDSDSTNVVVRPLSAPDSREMMEYRPGNIFSLSIPGQGIVRYHSSSTTEVDPHSNAQAIRDGHNKALQVVQNNNFDGLLVVTTRALNAGLINDAVPAAEAQPLTLDNFLATGTTPLFQATIAAAGDVLSFERRARDNWARSFTSATLVITDGASNDWEHTAEDVRIVYEGMQARGQHILAGMGIPDGQVDLPAQFDAMGIERNKQLHLGSSPADIEKALGLWAELIRQATAGNFKALKQGGFLALRDPNAPRDITG